MKGEKGSGLPPSWYEKTDERSLVVAGNSSVDWTLAGFAPVVPPLGAGAAWMDRGAVAISKKLRVNGRYLIFRCVFIREYVEFYFFVAA